MIGPILSLMALMNNPWSLTSLAVLTVESTVYRYSGGTSNMILVAATSHCFLRSGSSYVTIKPNWNWTELYTEFCVTASIEYCTLRVIRHGAVNIRPLLSAAILELQSEGYSVTWWR